MVRFIIRSQFLCWHRNNVFTFQYGQIYYEIEERINNVLQDILHSNMVRFIICFSLPKKNKASKSLFNFTFQYGQIYYIPIFIIFFVYIKFYIPIWLDLLSFLAILFLNNSNILHSNMVRFIIQIKCIRLNAIFFFTFQYGQIYYIITFIASVVFYLFYIPIWLDLLYGYYDAVYKIKKFLHSNMVRFIIRFFSLKYAKLIFSTY